MQVLVWAKSAVMRAGLEAIVQADARFRIAAHGGRAPDLAAAMRQFEPDMVLLDAAEGGKPPVFQHLAGDGGTPVVALIESAKRAEILRWLQSGVRGLLLRDAHPEEITAALHACGEGLAAVSPEILHLLLPTGTELADADELHREEPLTARETEVLAMLADGAGNKEIGSRLGISEHTVKFHVSSILGKLGATTRTEAVTRGYREGLILI